LFGADFFVAWDGIAMMDPSSLNTFSWSQKAGTKPLPPTGGGPRPFDFAAVPEFTQGRVLVHDIGCGRRITNPDQAVDDFVQRVFEIRAVSCRWLHLVDLPRGQGSR